MTNDVDAKVDEAYVNVGNVDVTHDVEAKVVDA